MKDRFKFRYLTYNKIYNVKDIDFRNNTISIELEDDEIVYKYTTLKLDYSKLVQCTGLKDKNGKLIYEGDIIQIQGCTEKAKVEYNLEKGKLELIGKSYAQSAFMTIRKDFWEVIGNIYENPELLQECE